MMILILFHCFQFIFSVCLRSSSVYNRIKIIKMHQQRKTQNVLSQQTSGQNLTSMHAKISFLQSQRARLELSLNEMSVNNALLRTINIQLTHQNPLEKTLATLNEQNVLLQQSYLRIAKQNQQLTAQILLMQQIADETLIENQHIVKGYEEKIIELRRLIQMKEINVQQLEKKYARRSDGSINYLVPANNITILFFNEVQELKKVIERLTIKNKGLQLQNTELKKKNQEVTKKLSLMEILTVHSKIMYEQFKHFYLNEPGQKRNRNSAPKRGIHLPFFRSPKKRQSDDLTKQCSSPTLTQADSSLKMQLYKEILQIHKFQAIIEETRCQVASEKAKNKRLALSFEVLERRNSVLQRQIRHLKEIIRDLGELLGIKRVRTASVDKKNDKKVRLTEDIAKIKLAKREQLTQIKNYWKSLQIVPEKVNVLLIKRRHRQHKRSLSCVCDYRMRNLKLEVEQPQKLIKKSYLRVPNAEGRRKSSDSMLSQRYNDLTLMMDDVLGGDISIIGPSTLTSALANHPGLQQAPKNILEAREPNLKVVSEVNMTILDETIL